MMGDANAPAADALETGSSLLERLADDMVARWADGERPLAEEYFERFPAVRQSRGAALELIAEELALRQEHGLPVSADELAARFPLWQAQVRALVRCQRVLGAPAPRLPEPGDTLGDFRLVSELGRGAHGRVYLATQVSLGGRPVVVKLGPVGGHEHLSLARLQHTHIVPLYSVHEFPDHALRGLCLPYFGGVTLDRVLGGLPAGAPTGTSLLASLLPTERGELAPPVRGPAWAALEGASFADAVCWIGVCLADALQYAHERGLLHLDVKPSNVLLAADATPMLLDFHLARAPLRAGASPLPWLGGTPGYMPPEQTEAVNAVRAGAAVPTDLDARADVYALGVVLNEMLRVGRPDAVAVPVGVTDILARCTATDPGARYPRAADLASDLRRHLADLPLRGVANRSLAERWRKWRRRKPLALPLALALGAVLAGATGFVIRAEGQAAGASAALDRGDAHMRHGRYAEAAETFRGGEVLLDGTPLRADLRRRLRDARLAAERAQVADELHTVCEQVRPLYAAEVVTGGQANAVAARCTELWARRDRLARTLEGQPTPELERRWRADLLDLAVLAARLDVRSAAPDRSAAARQQALRTLDEAETLLGPNVVLDLERAGYARGLGLTELADAAGRRAAARPPQTAWEHLLVGRAALGIGDYDRAAGEMERALALDPGCFWAHYHRGACALRAGEPADALAAFSACVALAPNSPWCLHNRGLAYAALSRLEQARADFDRAVSLDGAFGAAYLARARVHHRAGRHADALTDLRRADGAGVPAAAVAYQRAGVLLALDDRAAAIDCLRACLSADPGHGGAAELLARIAR